MKDQVMRYAVLLFLATLAACSHTPKLDKNKGIEMDANNVIAMPDTSKRPLRVTAEIDLKISPQEAFDAWTTETFTAWFAAPGTLIMKPQANMPYFFESHFEGQRHPHYGRFLKVAHGRYLEFTWLTEAGTKGAETVVTVDFTPLDNGTRLKLSHGGFSDEESRKAHAEAWPYALGELKKKVQ